VVAYQPHVQISDKGISGHVRLQKHLASLSHIQHLSIKKYYGDLMLVLMMYVTAFAP